VADFATNDRAEGVQVVGNHAFVATGSGGFVVIDVSTPVNPVRGSVLRNA
jgi:hypothetical protein